MPLVEPVLLRVLNEVLADTGKQLRAPLTPETVLLQSGLDSLGFAILVSRLEEELGYDPFLTQTESRYPRTWAEFVAAYEAGSIRRPS